MSLTGISPPATPPPADQSFDDKWIELKRHEAARQDILADLERLHVGRERFVDSLALDKRRLQAHEEQLVTLVDRLTQENRNLHERVDRAPFVVLLIDGDNTLFLDDLVRAEFDGGGNAAQLLKQNIKQYLDSAELGFQHHWKIFVHVYANMHGLAETYARSGILSDPADARKFFAGFNRELAFFEFVDAGNDKEAADKKIEQYFKHYHESANCKHVMLAGSGDRSYVTNLRQYTAEPTRVTLIEGVPFEPAFRSLSLKFKVVSFPDVFRVTKLDLSARVVPVQTASNTYAVVTSNIATPVTPVTSMANMSPEPTATRQPVASSSAPAPVRKIMLNRNNDRVDEPLNNVDMDIVNRFRSIREEARRPCSRFYLTRCTIGPGCKFDHLKTYGVEEKRAIKYMARSMPCFKRLACRDIDCIAGHVCPQGSLTPHSSCRFSPEMHGVDQVIAMAV